MNIGRRRSGLAHDATYNVAIKSGATRWASWVGAALSLSNARQSVIQGRKDVLAESLRQVGRFLVFDGLQLRPDLIGRLLEIRGPKIRDDNEPLAFDQAACLPF